MMLLTSKLWRCFTDRYSCKQKTRNNLGNGQMQNYASIRKSAKEEWAGAFVVCQNLPYIHSSCILACISTICIVWPFIGHHHFFFPHNPRKCNRGLLGPPTLIVLDLEGMKKEEVMMYLTFWLRLLLGLFSFSSLYSLPYSHQASG